MMNLRHKYGTEQRQRRPRKRWSGEVKRLQDLSAAEIELWRRLSTTRHELRSPFFSLEFAHAVADAGARTKVCLLYEDGALAGFFPFQFANAVAQAMGVGERVGGFLNGFCGIIIDQTRHSQISSHKLLSCTGMEGFAIGCLEEKQQHLAPSGTEIQGARIELAQSLESYWKSVKLRHRTAYDNLRNRERKLEREFRSVEFVFAHEEPARLLDLVIAEKSEQLRAIKASDALSESWKLRCLELIARYRQGACVPVLSTLTLNGEWAAVHFGVRSGSVLHYWFPVYNRKFHSLSPGLILLTRIISEAAAHNIIEIDLGAKLSQYKDLFATELYPLYRDVWFGNSVRGLTYHSYLSLAWRLQSALPRWRALPGSNLP
jgi:CelD/BcsL family acetyltransferase involved in cellulose biosynthesis